MNNQEKIQAVKTALTEKCIEHWTGVDTLKKNVKIDIYLPKHNIAIFDGHDDEKFKAVRFFTFPVFMKCAKSGMPRHPCFPENRGRPGFREVGKKALSRIHDSHPPHSRHNRN